ncbi:MAG: hypothetical protein ABIJ53_06700 [Verrucomicrobiota bacterium]
MDLLYAKYNRHRLPPFQIETTIWRDRDRKFVFKKALGPDAVGHLQRLHEQAVPIRHSLHGDRLRLPEVTVIDEQTLRFDFVEGRSLDALLVSAFREQDKARFLGIITDYLALLNSAFATVPVPVLTEAMRQVFGLASPAELKGLGPFLTPALMDPVFENILVNGDRHYLIDHEWVFEGCLPVSFVLFRSLFYFYEKNKELSLETWMPLAAVLERFALAPETVHRYREMDEAFQAHVFGRERCYRYKDRYAKYAYSVPWFLETIAYQRQVIDMMQNSRGWKFVQKTGRLMDTHFPPGTRRRRVLERILRHLQAFM